MSSRSDPVHFVTFYLKEKEVTSVNRESCMTSELLEVFLVGHFSNDKNFYVVPP